MNKVKAQESKEYLSVWAFHMQETWKDTGSYGHRGQLGERYSVQWLVVVSPYMVCLSPVRLP